MGNRFDAELRHTYHPSQDRCVFAVDIAAVCVTEGKIKTKQFLIMAVDYCT